MTPWHFPHNAGKPLQPLNGVNVAASYEHSLQRGTKASKIVYSRFLTPVFSVCLLTANTPVFAAESDYWAFNKTIDQYQPMLMG